MASPDVIDFEQLLSPVPGNNSAGPELRAAEGDEQRLYYAVRDARKKAGDSERRLRMYELLSDEEKEHEPGVPEAPNWDAVCELAVKALKKSKDLWITAWLIESLTRLHGFAGLRDGYRLAREYCRNYWGQVHPQPDQSEDLSTTFAQLAGLNGIESDGRNVDERVQRSGRGTVTADMFARAVNKTKVDHFKNLFEDLEQAIQAFQQFGDEVRTKLENTPNGAAFAPPSSSIQEALQECLRLLKVITRNVLGNGAETGLESTTVTVVDGSPNNSVASRMQTREEAFRALLQVSDFFRRTEPHSPVSYAVEQAVRWGRMKLPELLAELVADDSTRQEIFKRTGIHEVPREPDR
jgi:type VI secretion system protein ImpA